MEFPKVYIGPMSKNVVDAVIAWPKLIGLIASRRQVDYSNGYANNWRTFSFSEYVRKENSKVVLCRDHAGPMQGLSNKSNDLLSLKNDAEYFDIIHVDPFKTYRNIHQAAVATVDYIRFAYYENPNTLYEVGTEQAIFKYEPNELNLFLRTLYDELPKNIFDKICYVVIQSGTGLDLAHKTNTGVYSEQRLLDFIRVAQKYGKLTKEHNGDYLINSGDVYKRFLLGLDAINIAPEFGQIESEYYLEQCRDTLHFDKLYKICYELAPWRKWAGRACLSQEEIIMIGCHYVLSTPEFIAEVKNYFPDADKIIRGRIDEKLGKLYEQLENSD